MAIYKVYLSSTFRDLQEHRKEVIEFFDRFKDVFEITAMESYVAENTDALTKCRKDVEGCDIYILILANRYGTILPGDVCSITEHEYNTAWARKDKVKIFAFFANTANNLFASDNDPDPVTAQLKKEKLAAFRSRVQTERLAHPEGFISPFHLALQVAESLMKNKLLQWRNVYEYRQLCCNRGTQYGTYLTVFRQSLFKVFIIWGNLEDLGDNLINRFALFTLNLREHEIAPFITLQDFYSSAGYQYSRELLAVQLFTAVFNTGDVEYTLESFVRQVKKPVIVKIDISAECLDDQGIEFLRQAFDELNTICMAEQLAAKLYVFLNITDNAKEMSEIGALEERYSQFNAGQAPSAYLKLLPRLGKTNHQDIRQWISTYINFDAAVVLNLFNYCFKSLPPSISMLEVQVQIRNLIKRINNNEETILTILNN